LLPLKYSGSDFLNGTFVLKISAQQLAGTGLIGEWIHTDGSFLRERSMVCQWFAALGIRLLGLWR
jgi:hypothetical protein